MPIPSLLGRAQTYVDNGPTKMGGAFYDDIYAVLADFLGRIASKQAESACIQTGASVLLTVINGYGMVSQQLGINTEVMADELTVMIWDKVSA